MGQEIVNIGYLALPETPNGIGLIVIQEWWGLVPHIKAVVDRFAAAGYVALAPDLYKGTTTKSPDEAQRLFMALNIEQSAQELETAIDYLLKPPLLCIGVTSRQTARCGWLLHGRAVGFVGCYYQRVCWCGG